MLDLTDNLTDDGIVHPPRVRVLDDDGPYLVVAADKGTASFSDIANGLAIERGFWLGDAFASGGEHGYDHKKMGITARGAWESAQAPSARDGPRPDRGTPVTMIGIGDMSGDVFGNGLLHSDNLKLIAAFDHRHIFIDPDPDPGGQLRRTQAPLRAAALELGRLQPGADQHGRRRFPARPKAHRAEPASRAALGCDADALDGDSLIRAILRAPVELLYNGGIGTYVRASDETDADVGDHANDACRITAPELRAKIVVEGGNLGFTQRRASSTRSPADASTPTRSTIRPASICRITRSISRFCSSPPSRAAISPSTERNRASRRMRRRGRRARARATIATRCCRSASNSCAAART